MVMEGIMWCNDVFMKFFCQLDFGDLFLFFFIEVYVFFGIMIDCDNICLNKNMENRGKNLKENNI